MDDTIPGEAGIVDDDMNLAIPKFSGLLDQFPDMVVIKHIASHGDGFSAAGPNLINYLLSLFGIDICDNHLGTFICKESRALGTDSLSGPGDDGYLPV